MKFLSATSLPASAERRPGLGAFAAGLAVLIFALYPEVILGRATFFSRDFAIFGYPLAHHWRESFWRGEIPLWNPLNNCGLPFLAQWNTMVLYPPTLFYLLLPLSWALGVFCLAHLHWAGLGMYCLVHRWTGSRLAAVVAGVAYAFNGLTWHSLMWPNNVAALGWLPWVLLLAERGWQEGGRAWLWAVAAGTLQMLTGAPEVIFLTWAIVGGLWGMEILGRAVRERRVPWREGIRLPGLVALVGTLAAAQLLPFLDLLAHSQRNTNYGDADWAMPGTGWANFLVPLFRTYESFHGVHVQPGQYWTASYYVSIGALALAILGVMQVRDRRLVFLAGAGLLAGLLALGADGYLFNGLMAVVPQLGFMRFPIKFVIVPVLVLPILAGFGLAWIEKNLGDPAAERKRGQKLVAVGLTLAVLIAGLIWFARAYPLSDGEAAFVTGNGLVRALCLAALVALVWWAPRIRALRRGEFILACALAALLWIDVRTHAPNLNPSVDRSAYEPEVVRTAMKLEPEPTHGVARATISPAAFGKLRYRAVASPVEDVLGRRMSMFGNCNLLDGFSKLNGFYSLYLREMDPVIWHFYFSSNGVAEPLLDFLNVAQITAPERLLEWQPRTTALPMITIGQRPVFVDEGPAVSLLFDSRMDFRRVTLLPSECRGTLRATNASTGRIHSARVTAHQIEFEAEAEQPALVVLAQAFYHPWQATVDGVPTRLLRANHAFQALEIPAGRHRVSLVYRDRGFLAGCLVSLGALGAWALLLLRHRSRPSAPPPAGSGPATPQRRQGCLDLRHAEDARLAP